jgi:glycosyltransferase involved in cell wall biosynthesis
MREDSFFVSIIIPCRNEEKYIGRCLDSIILQDFPKENFEILIIDGTSEDKTREIVERYKIQNTRYKIQILNNPRKYTSFGLNIGLREARGKIIIRMDAHADYQKDYVSKCVKYLKEQNADNVGGIMKTLPADKTIQARAIADCLSHFFGAASSFRLGSKKVREVDTVFGGCYKKEVFEKIGEFNEKLTRSQDLEFNLRLKAAGGKIILVPDIVSFYYPSAHLGDFLRHNFSDGIWVTYPLKFGIRIFKLRHLLPLIFTTIVLLSLILGFFSIWFRYLFVLISGGYLILDLLFSIQVSLKSRLKKFFLMPTAFFIRHFGYGLGSLWGLIKILI